MFPLLQSVLRELSWQKPGAGNVLKAVIYPGQGDYAVVWLGKSHPGIVLTVTDEKVVVEKLQPLGKKVYKIERKAQFTDLAELMARLTGYRDRCRR